MTELELLRALGDETPLPELTELAAAHVRLMDAISSESATFAEPLVRRARRTQRPSRRLFLGAASVSVAVAAAVVLVALPGGSSHSIISPVGPFPAVTNPSGKDVLQRAAFVALQTTATTPSPDQFVYTETGNGDGQTSQTWMSVDGLQTSRIGTNTIPACTPGQIIPGVKLYPGAAGYRPGNGGAELCTPQPAYFPDMPTQADGMLAYLEQTQEVRGDDNADDLNDLLKQVGYMLDTYYILPAQQAALYEFLAQTPGITIKTDVTDSAGRPGIGVWWSYEGGGAMLIFNPRTYSYLGMTTVGTGGQIRGDALLAIGIVDQIGQLPEQDATPSPNSGA